MDMICPKAKECKNGACFKNPPIYRHDVPHEQRESCAGWLHSTCPKCIPHKEEPMPEMMICEKASKDANNGTCQYEWAGSCDRRVPHEKDSWCERARCVPDGTRCTEGCIPYVPDYLTDTNAWFIHDKWKPIYGCIKKEKPMKQLKTINLELKV